MSVRILHGDCRDVLKTLPDASVHCVVTSPPYWSLRDYGTPPVAWPAITYSPLAGLPPIVEVPAMDSSLGLEPTVEAFIGHMVLVFREVRRVLRDDGVLWMNMGDSYAGSRCGGSDWPGSTLNGAQPDHSRIGHQAFTAAQKNASATAKRVQRISRNIGGGTQAEGLSVPRSDLRSAGLKPKDMVAQPWRLALALQADGWWLRQDVIWHKPNPMPESARDRCTKAHEYVFLLAKSERYAWDFGAMQEPTSGGAHARRANNGVGFGHGYDAGARDRGRVKKPSGWDAGDGDHRSLAGRYVGRRQGPPGNPAEADLAGKDAGRDAQGLKHSERFGRGPGWRKLAEPDIGIKNNHRFEEATAGTVVDSRNRRSVWTIQTEPFKEAHFATFPPALVEPCIAAGCPVGGTVLDPFGGAGTTGLVADRLQRNAVLIELNPEYAAIAKRRITGDAPLFAEVA